MKTGPAELERQGAEEDEYAPRSGLTFTRREREIREKVAKRLSGRKEFELFLQCYQLILWKQSSWLVATKGLPAELEIIIRDLWALRLQKLTNKVDLSEANDEDGAQSQLYSSDSGSEADATRGAIYNRRRLSDTPSLIETLALCYMGILLLRLPISPGDIQKWAACGDMLYYRAFDALPEEMRSHFAIEHVESFTAYDVLKAGDVQSIAYNMSSLFLREFHMKLPPVNMPLLLYRYIKDLALPLEIYPCARKLAQIIKVPFTYMEKIKGRRAGVHEQPDTQILALIIIAAKLLYPISGLRVYPLSNNELGSHTLNWSAWLSAKRTHDQKFQHPERLSTEDAFASTEHDVLKWKTTEVDDYLTWYGSVFTEAEPPEDDDFQKALYDLFPTDANASPPPVTKNLKEDLMPDSDALEMSKNERLVTVSAGLKSRKCVSTRSESNRKAMGEATPRLGDHFVRFRDVESLDGVDGGDGIARALYEQAAEIAQLPLKSLFSVVIRMERRLAGWQKEESKKERFKERLKANGRRQSANEDEPMQEEL
ncbi:MAG: Pol I core factor CF [Bogoriella megaspora]|nr:MAG: Pol I core factor CF [Bogoriella megaspora]